MKMSFLFLFSLRRVTSFLWLRLKEFCQITFRLEEENIVDAYSLFYSKIFPSHPLCAVVIRYEISALWGLSFYCGLVQFSCSVIFATPWTTARQGLHVHHQLWSLPKLMSIELMMPSNHLILYCPVLLLLPSIFPSIRVFSNELTLLSQ